MVINTNLFQNKFLVEFRREMEKEFREGKSFLERDNFENELGSNSEDPFGENFSQISQHEIVDVFAEGDLAGRFVF